MKTTNEYAESFGEYREIPKAVFAAVALSFALRLVEVEGEDNGDMFDLAEKLVVEEWHRAGIVPQKP